jgi:hypothetical protein
LLLTSGSRPFRPGGRYDLVAKITGMALPGARSVTYGGGLVTSSCPVAAVWGQDLMTIHRTGMMATRGAHARNTGSTTGVATAVLALLSAGTLASFGLVTADELRGGTSGSLRAPYNDLLPPVDVVVTPRPRGHDSDPSGGGGGSRPVLGPFEQAAVTGGVDGSGPTLAAAVPGEIEALPTVAPTQPLPAAPVLSSLDPTSVPSVLATKHGRALGHAHARGQANKPAGEAEGTVAAAATPTSLMFLGSSPAASSGRHARAEHGGSTHPGSAHGRAAHQAPGEVTDPALPATAPAPVVPAVAPTADPSGPGNGHGHAYGHDEV